VLEETRTEPSAVIAERIVADAVAFQGGLAADDAAVLVLKVPG
jgi:hypothetical protein